MKVFRWSNFKDVGNIIISMVVLFVCLLRLGVYADNNVGMGIFGLPSGIEKVYKNESSTKYKITALYDIYKITDQNGESNKIKIERISGRSALFSTNGVTKVKVYSNLGCDEVDLSSASVITDVVSPHVIWSYKDKTENVVWFEVQDEAGLYEIKSTKEGRGLRIAFTEMRQNAIVSVKVDNVDNLAISDIFGNTSYIDISDVTLEVSKALKNVDGSKAILKLSDYKEVITGLEYLDGEEVGPVSTNGIENTYNLLPGTTMLKVRFGDKYAIIQLDTDAKSPDVVRAWKKEDGSRILLEFKDDESGIGKISYYSKNIKQEEIFKEFPNNDVGGVGSYDVSEGVTHVYIYDGVGNRTRLAINSIDIDNEKPAVKIQYRDGKYKLIVKKEKSGIDKVTLDGNDVDTYKDYPVGEFTYTYEELNGDTYVVASDGVGNIMKLTVNEIISLRKRGYKNNIGDIISINIEDDRGIWKITDQDEHVIERFWCDEREVNSSYKVRKNIDSINVYYGNDGNDKYYNIKLQELTQVPQVLDEVYENELITKCVVASKAGIKKIEYSDGRKILFKKDMPDDITVNCTRLENDVAVPTFVTVYDALGNSVEINEKLKA